MTAQRCCYCPGDCNCRHQGAPYYRPNVCGCKQHPKPIATAELRAALAAGADFAAGSEIIAARVLAAAARI